MIGKRFGAIPLKDAEKSGVAFAEKIKVSELAKLRQIPAEQLLDESSKPGNFDLKIVADGYFLNKQITEVFANGEQAKVPLLVGWTSAEIPYMAFMQGQYPSPENYKKLVQDMYKENANEVLKYYPGNTQEEVIESATALGSDNFIVFGTWKWLNMHRKTTKQPTYSYIFSKARPSDEAKTNGMPAPLKGANHASDIEYMLGNLPTNTVYEWTADDYKTSEVAEEYLANFIKTGNPNGKGLPEWPVNKEEGDLNIMTLDKVSKPGKEKHRDRYLFLDSYETVKK
jgi:para-nitrobenzyl esterase